MRSRHKHIWLWPWQEHRRCAICGRMRTLAIGDETVTIADTYAQLPTSSTPANPAANFLRLYAQSDGLNFQSVDSSGNTWPLAGYVLVFGASGVGVTADFLVRAGNVTAPATETVNTLIEVPMTGRLRGMRVHATTSPGGGQTTTFTTRITSVDSALVTTISNAATTGGATSDVAVSVGDYLTVRVDFTGASPGACTASVLLV